MVATFFKKKLKLNNWLKNKLDERLLYYIYILYYIDYTIISIVTEYLVDIIVTKSNINSNEISVNSLLSFAFRST